MSDKKQVKLIMEVNKEDCDVVTTVTSDIVNNALGYTPMSLALKGASSGVSELDDNGKVVSSQLPSFVDDVIEGYLHEGSFYKESTYMTKITEETGKIYIDLSTEKTYRWSGSQYTVISDTIALGETSSTAYRGDRGKIAYDHSQAVHAPSNAEKNQNAFANVKVGDVTISAGTTSDTLNVAAGNNVTITTDSDTDTMTISAKDTTYTNVTDSASGLMTPEYKVKLDGIAEGANNYTLPSAGSSLGGVKTGGDVTISSGVITVNDDSHNHVIANVDGLQTALDGKAPTNHSHYYAGSSSVGGVATSANKWATVRNINGLSVDGTADRVNYGTCSTAAGTAAKVVACAGFALVTGAEITVKFTVTNTASSPTLNVNSTGAKSIYYRGSAITAGYLAANRTYTFRYNGTQYDLVGDIDTNTTYSSLKNPYALTIQGNGTTLTNGTYDGSAAKTVNITPSSIGAAASSHSHSYLPLSGDTMTGNVSFNMNGSTQIPLKIYGGNANGQGISVGAGAATIVGGGESAKACESLLGATTEELWLASDTSIRFYTNCQTIGNKVGAIFNTYREFLPDTNNTGSLGTSSYKWANVYATKVNGYTLAAACARGVNTASGKTHTNYGTNNTYVPDMAFLAYWNGAYNSSGSSNITYCVKGAFGDAAIKGVDTTATSESSNLITSGAMYTALAGKAPSSHGTHVTFSTTTPAANGTAAVGSATTVSRSDHVHPLQTSVSGNAGTATKWATARNINGLSVDGTANRVNYGTCSTAAATAAKVVACTGFALVTGAEITVKFTVTNTASSPTLNVNSTGAKAIYYRGSAISAGYLAANRTYTFRYNGTQYDLVGDINTNTDTLATQTNTTTSASYRVLLSYNANDTTGTYGTRKSGKFLANPSTGVFTASGGASFGGLINSSIGSLVGQILYADEADVSLTIDNLWNYSTLLVTYHAVKGSASNSGYLFTTLLPIKYINNGNQYNVPIGFYNGQYDYISFKKDTNNANTLIISSSDLEGALSTYTTMYFYSLL